MKMKKVLALVLAFALTITATIGGTMAYLQAHVGDKTNTFQVGGLTVTLTETTDVITIGGGKVDAAETGADYTEIMPGDKIVKEVTVTNNHETEDAYVKVVVTLKSRDKDGNNTFFARTLNSAIDEKYGDDAAQGWYDLIFDGWGLNHGKDLDGDGTNDAGMRLTITGADMPEYVLQVDSVKTIDEYINAYTGNWFGEKEDVIPFDGYYTTGMDKYELKYIYYIDLPATKSTTLFNGFNVPMEFNADQLAMFEGLVVDITADAVQKANFENARTAFLSMAVGDGTTVVDYYHKVTNDEELEEAILSGWTKIELADATYHMPVAAQGKTLTFRGTRNAVIEVVPAGQGEAGGQLDYSLDGSNVTFNGVTIKTNSQLYAGFARLSATYNDCVIQNTYNLGVGDSVFNNCEFNITNEYLRVGGAYNAEFNNCTFNTDGRAILIFQDGTRNNQTVTVRGCTFNATAPAYTWNGIHVAAVSYDGSQGGTYAVNFEGKNVVDSDFNGLWQIKAGEENVTVNLNVDTWDGAADTSWYNEEATEFTITTAEELAGLAKLVDEGNTFEGKTVKLGANLDLYAVDANGNRINFDPIGHSSNGKSFNGTFDGQGNTISNLYKQNDLGAWQYEGEYYGLFAYTNGATIKNVEIADAYISSGRNEAAAVVGNAVDTKFENITVSGTTLIAYNNSAGGVAAECYGDCSFENIVVDEKTVIGPLWGTYDVRLGGVVGMVKSSDKVTFKNVSVSCKLDAINDVAANYQYWLYRYSGMLIGQVDGVNGIADPTGYVTCENVEVTYGDWVNYHYCEFAALGAGSYNGPGEYKYARVEAGTGTDGIDLSTCNHSADESHNVLIVFDQLFGGGQGVSGLKTYDGVTVVYP